MCKEERILVLVFSITYAIILLVFVITVRYIGEGVHNMKKRFEAFLIVCLSISTLIFALLWQIQKNNKDEILGHWRRPVPLMLVSSLPNIRLMVAKAAIGTGLRPFALFSKHIIH